MSTQQQIAQFLDGSRFAVVGASRDRAKYGNKVLRAYLQNDRKVFAVNPNADEVEDIRAFPDLASLPEPVDGISVITPPNVTEKVVEQAGELGIKIIWMQPGSESEAALASAKRLGIDVISGGPCALVVLGFRDS